MAKILGDGKWPYADYFFAHPAVARGAAGHGVFDLRLLADVREALPDVGDARRRPRGLGHRTPRVAPARSAAGADLLSVRSRGPEGLLEYDRRQHDRDVAPAGHLAGPEGASDPCRRPARRRGHDRLLRDGPGARGDSAGLLLAPPAAPSSRRFTQPSPTRPAQRPRPARRLHHRRRPHQHRVLRHRRRHVPRGRLRLSSGQGVREPRDGRALRRLTRLPRIDLPQHRRDGRQRRLHQGGLLSPAPVARRPDLADGGARPLGRRDPRSGERRTPPAAVSDAVADDAVPHRARWSRARHLARGTRAVHSVRDVP